MSDKSRITSRIIAQLRMARVLLDRSRMSRPRQILPNSFYMLQRRTTQRMFLLRPDDETNNAFTYCLVEAALRYDIDILLPMCEANHHHTICFDRHGNFPEFIEHFHKMLAKCLNHRLKRRENFWSSSEVCYPRLLDRATVIDKLVYAATNPVKDFLVERAHHWPGVNGYVNLLKGRPLIARRPTFFFAPDGEMPEEVSMPLTIPPELGPAEIVIEEVRQGVIAVEKAILEERTRTNKPIMQRNRILKLKWHQSPTSVEPHRELRPRFAGRPETRVPALLEYRDFLVGHRKAREEWRAGRPAQFPAGTYWLARFAPIAIAS